MREHSCGMNEGMLVWSERGDACVVNEGTPVWSEWGNTCVEWVRGCLCEVNEWTLVWGSPQSWEYVCHFITFPWSTCKEQDPGYIHSDCSWDVSGGERWAVWRAQDVAETAGLRLWDWVWEELSTSRRKWAAVAQSPTLSMFTSK